MKNKWELFVGVSGMTFFGCFAKAMITLIANLIGKNPDTMRNFQINMEVMFFFLFVLLIAIILMICADKLKEKNQSKDRNLNQKQSKNE